MTRAKFIVESKSQDGREISLRAVTTGSEENKQFFALTPSGHVQLSTVNKAASDEFVVGKQYYVDFTKAE